MSSNRRSFFKQSAVGGGAFAAYAITGRTSWAEQVSGKPTVAAIGVGGSRGRFNQGRHIANRAAEFGELTAVVEVDALHAQEFNAAHGGKLRILNDYRVLLEKHRPDVVTIGTPDHWHIPISIAALRAGCDVYCEKPLTLTIDEGKQICDVVRETGRVFQVGTQQRSENDLRFLKAIALVRSGRLGKNVKAYIAIGGPPEGEIFPTHEPPEDLDWEMWVGPAPKAPYSEERRQMFRWFFEYSGGKMTDWGAHHMDIALWALGKEHTGPVSVAGTGKFPPIIPDQFNWNAFLDGEIQLPNAFNTPDDFSLDLKFADGTLINMNSYYRRDDGTEFENGILFEGDEGRIFVNRSRLSGAPVEGLDEADKESIHDQISELYKGKEPGHHMRNFFECIEDREQPISDVFTHHRTMTALHLCNISLMLGRKVEWDPEQEQFRGDDQATQLMSRKSHELPAIEATA